MDARYGARGMNAKLLFKIVFVLALWFLLVLLGRENRGTVEFTLPPLIPQKFTLPAAEMYYIFFAVGVVSGVILALGGNDGNGGGKSNKSKSGK